MRPQTSFAKRVGRVVLVLVFAATTAGCPASMKQISREEGPLNWPAGVPQVGVDRAASSLTYASPSMSIRKDLGAMQKAREDIAMALEASGTTGGVVTPIRFRIHAQGDSSAWPTFFPCFFYFTVFGCPIMKATATASVTYDIGGKLYIGNAEGSGWIGLYYNQGQFANWDVAAYRAIMEATRMALRFTQHAHLIDRVREGLGGGLRISAARGSPP
jgi:hypothetical protein